MLQVQAGQNISTKNEMLMQSFYPNQEAVCNRYLLGKEKSVLNPSSKHVPILHSYHLFICLSVFEIH